MINDRKNYSTESILAESVTISNDTWQTHINNNVLVVGPTGSGKTRNYVKPNIMQANTSMIISDAKGSLYQECADYLKSHGYTVYKLDFVNMVSDIGYNPMHYIRMDPRTKRINEQDVMKLSEVIISDGSKTDPFWDMAARFYLQSLLAYVLEELQPEEQTLDAAIRLMIADEGNCFSSLMIQKREIDTNALSVRRYNQFCSMGSADKMIHSILGVAVTNLSCFDFNSVADIYRKPKLLDFSVFGKQKTALFLTVSDTDRSMDKLINLFWTQALQELCLCADRQPMHCLDVPVRLYLDDFATNVYIPNFDKISSNIRSREIYVSIILQSLSQLQALYGESRANTIISNCDQQLILGIQDTQTAEFFAARADRPRSYMMNMPLESCIVILRGQEAKVTKKYDITSHEGYQELLEYEHGELPF